MDVLDLVTGRLECISVFIHFSSTTKQVLSIFISGSARQVLIREPHHFSLLYNQKYSSPLIARGMCFILLLIAINIIYIKNVLTCFKL